MRTYDIVLRRRNGRFVKILETRPSRYAAKQRLAHWYKIYDESYEIVIEPT